MNGVVMIDALEGLNQLTLEPFALVELKCLTLKKAFKRRLDAAILRRLAAVNPAALVVLVDFIPGRQRLGCYVHGLIYTDVHVDELRRPAIALAAFLGPSLT